LESNEKSLIISEEKEEFEGLGHQIKNDILIGKTTCKTSRQRQGNTIIINNNYNTYNYNVNVNNFTHMKRGRKQSNTFEEFYQYYPNPEMKNRKKEENDDYISNFNCSFQRMKSDFIDEENDKIDELILLSQSEENCTLKKKNCRPRKDSIFAELMLDFNNKNNDLYQQME
jgi:hypothetical protein